jgi:deoxyribodipyrimidine photolyase-related protein
MSSVSLVFPHQLFKVNPAVKPGRPVYLVEESLFFRQFRFHKQKLILHRATMRFYNDYLEQQNHAVTYIETADERDDVRLLIKSLSIQQINQIHIADVTDDWLLKRIKTSCNNYNINLVIYRTPYFLNTLEGVAAFFDSKRTYFQTDFYIQQRKEKNILLEKDGRPLGDKWSFDYENRSRFPKKEMAPKFEITGENAYIKEATQYIEKHFSANYGNADGPYFFATDFKMAEDRLQGFLLHRFQKFGVYEDAIVANEQVLHHSVLSPLLNCGLLTPRQVIDAALEHASNHSIPLNSLEGFVRQVMGWREFIRIVYEREGARQRTTNYWKFKRKIPASFWSGTTGILPVDLTIKKVLQTGYCHHIERLMVLGNFMVLCEFDPDEVYKWFMEMFLDAYDWVMVPNVYGMTQYADGGLMTTKPYISGSNYLMKMSDYSKGNWQVTWDGLFWRFMQVHRDFFLKNPRLGMLVKTFDKMPGEKKVSHLNAANTFLKELDNANDY